MRKDTPSLLLTGFRLPLDPNGWFSTPPPHGDRPFGPQDQWGQTPLHMACANGHTRTVVVLLHFKANPALANLEGNTRVEGRDGVRGEGGLESRFGFGYVLVATEQSGGGPSCLSTLLHHQSHRRLFGSPTPPSWQSPADEVKRGGR